eukprot:TRINITY_DN4322_c0_g5_i1.p1 TRINITY_DN4322_c0_g5~~TRINITY_DN4322_c0_g5_i1.p1  ORF type:complete len:195 (+),score=24.43 TRINITY_DN4322_c0_g5_i1:64-648(+)
MDGHSKHSHSVGPRRTSWRAASRLGRPWFLAAASWLLASTALPTVAAIDMEWTSYSDKADLPMSSQWREEMKAKLSRVDTSKLSAKEKMQYKTLWRKLNGGGEGGSNGMAGVFEDTNSLLFLLCLFAAIAYYAHSQGLLASSGTSGGQALGSSTPQPSTASRPFGSEGTVIGEDARAARLRRFQGESAEAAASS